MRSPRIAYCVIAHKDPQQVRRMIDRIHAPEDHFYLSLFNRAQNSAGDAWDRELQKFEGPSFTIASGYQNGWGSFSLVRATLDAMEHLRGVDYDYFINLSGQCYPLKTVPDIKAQLSAADGNGFIECHSLPWDRWSEEGGGFDRIYRTWYKPFKSLAKVSFPRPKRMPLDMRPYGGSQWFCLPKAHVDHVLDVVARHPEVCRFFQRSLIPDEMFFQTLLMNSPYSDRLQTEDNLRFIDWSKKCTPLPAVLLSEDLRRIMSSGKLFARKFDPAMDAHIIDLLDTAIDSGGDS